MPNTFVESTEIYYPITPHATAKLEHGKCRAIFVGGAGTVVAYNRDGTAVSFTAPAGAVLPIKTDRVLNTSTATNIVALY